MMERPAVIFNNGEGFVSIAMFETDLYNSNVTREQDFIVPIMVPDGMSQDDVLDALNSGNKRLLKSNPAEISVGERKIEHKRLSKR